MHAPVLRYFREVADRGSIRKAAETLNVASSAVNRQILKLEDEMGVLLFERIPGGVQLTAAGQILQDHIRETLLEFDRVQAHIDNIITLKAGVVRIAALGSLLVDFLPEVVRAYNDEFPDISFEVIELGPADSVEEVITGRVDIALTFTHALERPVRVIDEIETPIGAVVAGNHPLARKKAIRLSDCVDYPLLLHEAQLPEGPTSRAAFIAAGINPEPILVSNSLPMTRKMILANKGVAFFTRLAFRQEIAGGELAHIPFADDRSFALKIGIIVAESRRLSPAALKMVEYLETSLRHL
jgi:DNA-binding transcriptional LysR family regulator